MAVEKKEDRDKLEEYFKQKLNPLLMSGAYKAVDWDRVSLELFSFPQSFFLNYHVFEIFISCLR